MWLEAGPHEHASIASFNRQAIILMAHNAPERLISDAQRGAIDEIDHTKRSFTIGSCLGGVNYTPDVFPQHKQVIARSLERLALDTMREGAYGETQAVARLAWKARYATAHRGLQRNYELLRDDE